MTEVINEQASLPPAVAGGYDIATIEKIADYLRKSFKLDTDDELRSILATLSCNIAAASDDRNLEIHGTLEVKGPNQWTVYLPSHTGPIQDRFTLAHELGHYVLHSKFGEVPLKASRTFNSNATPDLAEIEADAFAFAFLMPKEKVEEAIIKYGKDAEILSAEFEVDLAVSQIRLKSID